MRKKIVVFCLVFAGLSACLLSCMGAPGDEPLMPRTNIVKKATDRDGEQFPLRIATFIDVENHNPLNSGDYYLEDRTPFFDFVILGAAQIRRPDGPNTRINLYIPSGLQHVLDNAETFIRPLQRKGIKVLVSITGGRDNISFGNIMDDDSYSLEEGHDHFLILLGQDIASLAAMYLLDGVELFDTAAARLPVTCIDEYPYPDSSFEGDTFNEQPIDKFPHPWQWEERQRAWGMYVVGEVNTGGGHQLLLLAQAMRQRHHYLDEGQHYSERPIIVREINQGAFVTFEPRAFATRLEFINFYINSEYGSFGSSRVIELVNGRPEFETDDYGNRVPIIRSLGGTGRSSISQMVYSEYAPFSINLLSPAIYCEDGNDIERFTDRFLDGIVEERRQNFGLIFYNNLRAISAIDEGYIDTRPESPAFGQPLSQADVFSITSEVLFGQRVITTNADRPITWDN